MSTTHHAPEGLDKARRQAEEARKAPWGEYQKFITMYAEGRAEDVDEARFAEVVTAVSEEREVDPQADYFALKPVVQAEHRLAEVKQETPPAADQRTLLKQIKEEESRIAKQIDELLERKRELKHQARQRAAYDEQVSNAERKLQAAKRTLAERAPHLST